MVTRPRLQVQVRQCLLRQGYGVEDGHLKLQGNDKASYRQIHQYARQLKLGQQSDFIVNNRKLAMDHIVDGSKIDVNKISPKLIEVKTGSKWETLFRWWCLVWWSIPYERPIGRQMRFVIWDKYHNSVIGLIGLQSPILAWAPRDQYLKLDKTMRETWVNQSMNAQRVGAIPPYNQILGSRLVASMLISKEVRLAFQRKYKGRKTEMENRLLPNRLLFITTTGAFGKSPIYDRLSHNGHKLSFFLGYTQGFGSFHITDDLYQQMLDYLKARDVSISRGYGSGPSRKMKLINIAMNHLGFKKGTRHQIKRGVYLFTPVTNLHSVIHDGKSPKHYNLSVAELADFWRKRWLLPRLNTRQSYLSFRADEYINNEMDKIGAYEQ